MLKKYFCVVDKQKAPAEYFIEIDKEQLESEIDGEPLGSDIDNNFKVLHIDTSIEINKKKVNFKKSIERLFELYEYCYSYSQKKKKEILTHNLY